MTLAQTQTNIVGALEGASAISVESFEDRFEIVGAEINRLHAEGHNLIPLGGDDGKCPLVAFKDRKRLPVDIVLRRMLEAESTTYGVRLGGMIVVDIDTDTAAANQLVKERFGESSVQVSTPRGHHHYFRASGFVPNAIHKPGLDIDIKHGPNSFVVGPGSVRPDSGAYKHRAFALTAVDDLPIIVRSDPAIFRVPDSGNNISKGPSPLDASNIDKGERHSWLIQKAISLCRHATSKLDLLGQLKACRDNQVRDPGSVPDSELAGIADWAWQKRLENKLWIGQQSAFHIPRPALTDILQIKNGADAFALYSLLVSIHGHQPSAPFCVVPEALKTSGRLDWGRNRIYGARTNLCKAGYLRLVTKGRNRKPDRFLLSRPSDNSSTIKSDCHAASAQTRRTAKEALARYQILEPTNQSTEGE